MLFPYKKLAQDDNRAINLMLFPYTKISIGRQLRAIQEYNCIVLVQKNMIFDVVIVRGRAGLSKNQPDSSVGAQKNMTDFS